MFHHYIPQVVSNKKLLLDCRKSILKTIQHNIPLNECPSFYYSVQGEIVYVSSKKEQDKLTKKLNDALGKGDTFECCLCLKTKEGYGFVLIEIDRGSIKAHYQKPPTIFKGDYMFKEIIPIKDPMLSLYFLFANHENIVYH